MNFVLSDWHAAAVTDLQWWGSTKDSLLHLWTTQTRWGCREGTKYNHDSRYDMHVSVWSLSLLRSFYCYKLYIWDLQ